MGRLRRRVPKGYATSTVGMPCPQVRPLHELGKRGLLTLVLLMISTLVVWLGRDPYIDNIRGDGVSFIDALYYPTVTMTTTDYSDITPFVPHAQLLNAILITPMCAGPLVLLVGTAIVVLADEGSRVIRDLQWRQKIRNHVVVIGYGMKGRSVINTLHRHEEPDNRIVVIDSNGVAVSEANLNELAAFLGDGTRCDLLRRAEVSKTRKTIIRLSRDGAAILTILTARQLNPGTNIVVSVHEKDSAALVRQSGAISMVTSSDTVGRLLGLSAVGLEFGAIIQDLLTAGTGPEVQRRQVRPSEVGQSPNDVKGERVIGTIHNGTLRRFYDFTTFKIQTGDQLIVVRRVERPNLRDIDD